MQRVFYAQTDDELSAIETAIYRRAISIAEAASGMPGKVSITKISFSEDLSGGEPFFLVTRREIRVGSNAPLFQAMRAYPLKRIDELVQEIPEMRAYFMAPFEPEPRFRRPETDILHVNDYILFCPSAMRLLGQTSFNFDQLELDVRQTYNEPARDLPQPVQEGLEATRRTKGEALEVRSAFEQTAREAYFSVLGYYPERELFKRLQGRHLAHQIESLARAEAKGAAQAADLSTRIERLHRGAGLLEAREEEAEQHGVATFSGAIEAQGLGMPSTVASPDEATTRLALGTRRYLFELS